VYPRDRFEVIVIDARSADRTGAIIDAIAARHPMIQPLHRKAERPPGESAALKESMELTAEMIFLDADYRPGPDLVRKLVGPSQIPSSARR
jgi:1,2-diacylglycerol 3-beta-glucosyltransferase